MKTLHLPVPARRVGRREDVANAVLDKELAQGNVAAIAHRAVGHHSSDRDAVAGEPGQGALDERNHGRTALVGEQLAVGQPRMVVDDGVEVVVAERVGALKPGRASIARDGVTWPPKARIALDVHVQQVARTRPLVADHFRARLARRP
jgi:hypothetical protein